MSKYRHSNMTFSLSLYPSFPSSHLFIFFTWTTLWPGHPRSVWWTMSLSVPLHPVEAHRGPPSAPHTPQKTSGSPSCPCLSVRLSYCLSEWILLLSVGAPALSSVVCVMKKTRVRCDHSRVQCCLMLCLSLFKQEEWTLLFCPYTRHQASDSARLWCSYTHKLMCVCACVGGAFVWLTYTLNAKHV